MWAIKPQKVRKSLVLVKAITRFRKSDAQIAKNIAAGKSGNPMGMLKDPIASMLIDNQRGKVFKLQYSRPLNGTKRYDRWVLVHPSKWEHPTFIDGKRRKVPDVLKPKVEVKGEREAFETRIEFYDRLSRFTGPDFAEHCIALLTLEAKELYDDTD